MRAAFTLLFASLLVSSGRLAAQQAGVWMTDSTTMGPSYPLDVFYSLKNGVQKSDSNKNWHLAFEVTPGMNTGVAILANFAQTGAGGGPTATPGIQVWSVGKPATATFTTLAASDTTGKMSENQALYNNPNSWSDGAFNRNRTNSQYDFGWGMYDQNSHNVYGGDIIYILKLAGKTYKMTVQQYTSTPADSINYTFRIAEWNNNNDRTVTVRRSPDARNANFVYYNILTNTSRNHEAVDSTWDFVFTRYGDTAYNAGVPQVYASMGILANKGFAGVKAQGLNPDTTGFMNKAYSTRTNIIGANWKIINGTVFTIDTVSYFLKSKSTQEYYLLRFKSFGGSANGKTVFEKMYLGKVPPPPPTPVAVATTAAATAFVAVVPNPAATEANVLIDANTAGAARVLVTDLTGRTLQAFPADLKSGLNAFRLQTASLPTGLYLVTVAGADWKQTQQLAVQH